MPLSPRMKWKLQRYGNSLEERLGRWRELFRGALSKQKVCPACRALVSARESRCPFCNEPLSAFQRVGVRRITAGILPTHAAYSSLLLGANFLLFGLSILAATKAGQGFAGLLGGLPGRVLVDLGANYGLLVHQGQYWRLLTGTFLHASLIHLLFNMMVLFDVGPAVEEMYGPSRFLTLYLLAGICGSLASYWWRPFTFMVGASGALFGLIGVMVAYGYRHRSAMAQQIKSMYVRWAIYGLVYGLVFSFLIPIDNAAHIGGLLAGVAFGLVVSDIPPITRESILFWRTLNYLCWLLLAGSFLLVALNYGRLR